MNKSEGGRSHVRFSEKEWEKIEKDRIETKRSIPHLLKATYFNSGGVKVLINNINARSLIGHIGKIGNNINQIARKVNTGNQPMKDELEEINKQLRQILHYLGRYCGNS
jgi:hypothetical protein